MTPKEKAIARLSDTAIATIYSVYPSIELSIDERVVDNLVLMHANAVRKNDLDKKRQEALKLGTLDSWFGFLQAASTRYEKIKVEYNEDRDVWQAKLPVPPFRENDKMFYVWRVLPQKDNRNPYILKPLSHPIDILDLTGKKSYWVENDAVYFHDKMPQGAEVIIFMVADSVESLPDSSTSIVESDLEAQVLELVKQSLIQAVMPKDQINDRNPPTTQQ